MNREQSVIVLHLFSFTGWVGSSILEKYFSSSAISLPQFSGCSFIGLGWNTSTLYCGSGCEKKVLFGASRFSPFSQVEVSTGKGAGCGFFLITCFLNSRQSCFIK